MNCQANNIFSIIAIAKFENQYLEEWINYHLKIGFDFIHIYDNSDNGSISIPVKFKEKVIVYHYPGRAMQLKAYQDFITNRSKNNLDQWVAPIDIDEFIVLKECRNIKEFIKNRRPQKAIAFNWRIFGSNSHVKNNKEPVLSRFTRAKKNISPQIKCMFHRSAIIDDPNEIIFPDPHRPIMKPNMDIYNCEGNTISNEPPFGDLTTNAVLEKGYIAHFFAKSEEEYLNKIRRGRADTGLEQLCRHRLDDPRSMEDNKEEDLSALNIYNQP